MNKQKEDDILGDIMEELNSAPSSAARPRKPTNSG